MDGFYEELVPGNLRDFDLVQFAAPHIFYHEGGILMYNLKTFSYRVGVVSSEASLGSVNNVKLAEVVKMI